MQKFLLGSSLIILGTIASRSWGNSTEIVSPASNHTKTHNGKRACHTDYLIFHGAWKHGNQVLEALSDHTFMQATVPGYHPADIQTAYNIPANSGTKAIAIIDAYDLPTNLNDFNVFSQEFGLPMETSPSATASTNKVLQVVYPSGQKPTSNGDWGQEIAIDMEWAHAVAPKAKIYLVECPSEDESDLFNGVQYVTENFPDVGVVSMSFGGSEDPTELQSDSVFTAQNVLYLAAIGDTPNTVTYPSTSPNVISVGGTSLNYSGGVVKSEVYWYNDKDDAGSAGPSTVEPIPSYQSSVSSIVGSFRGTNDISADADPNTGCAIYDSTPGISDTSTGWQIFGGTSLACPICAGILDARGCMQPTCFAELTQLYSLGGSSYFRDITSGTSGVYKCAKGYDFLTGFGAPTGVYVNHPYTLTGGGIISGTRLSGTPGNMVVEDNHDYVVRSVSSGSGQVATIAATFSGGSLPSTAVGGTLTVSGTSTGATTTVSALNPTTKVYDSLGTVSLTGAASTSAISTSTLSNYVNSSGVIQIRISSSGVGATAARLSLDQVTFQVGSLN